jgi:hypothetical protein
MRNLAHVRVAVLFMSAFAGACSKAESSSAPGASAAHARPPPPVSTTTAQAAVSGGTLPAACTLATTTDLADTLGMPFVPSPSQPPLIAKTMSICNFNQSGGKSLIVRTQIADRGAFDAAAKALPGGDAITDVGDAAYFQSRQAGSVLTGTLLVLKGQTMLGVTHGGMNADRGQILAAERALATKVLPKL